MSTVFLSSLAARSALIVAVILALAAPRAGVAQVVRRPVTKTLIGDAALIVNARSDGKVEIGAAGDGPALEMTFPLVLVRQWVDSAQKALRFRPRRRADSVVVRAELEDPAAPGNVLALSKRVARGRSTFTLFVSDSTMRPVRADISEYEAGVLVAAMRRAVERARALRESVAAPKAAPKAAPPARAAAKPAPRRPGSPPPND